MINNQIAQHAEIIRKGELAENSLLGMIAGKSNKGKTDNRLAKHFPIPEGTQWKDITIELVSNESIRVKVNGEVERYIGFDIGFTDHRRKDMLNKQWDLLVLLAENGGAITWDSSGHKRTTSKQIQELNKILRQFFNLQENPIAPYNKKDGWVAKFVITDKSSGKL